MYSYTSKGYSPVMETIEFTTYTDEGDEIVLSLPAQFEVCPTCHGRGQHSRNLGAFTADDMDELGFEFQESYMAGHYDSQCETCTGQRVVLMVDERRADLETLELYWREQAADAEYARERANEMRWGY